MTPEINNPALAARNVVISGHVTCHSHVRGLTYDAGPTRDLAGDCEAFACVVSGPASRVKYVVDFLNYTDFNILIYSNSF